MNELKRPSTLLSVTSIIGLVSVSVYFYKQNALVKKQLDETVDTLNQVSKKVAELSSQSTQLVKLIRAVEKINQDLKNVSVNTNYNIGDIEELRNDITSILYTLESKDFEIISPEPKVKFKSSSNKKQQSKKQQEQPKSSMRRSERKQQVIIEDEENRDSEEEDISEPELDGAINIVRSNRR
jgi:uncharacterized phage infection (PIP) family protein YhgE